MFLTLTLLLTAKLCLSCFISFACKTACALLLPTAMAFLHFPFTPPPPSCERSHVHACIFSRFSHPLRYEPSAIAALNFANWFTKLFFHWSCIGLNSTLSLTIDRQSVGYKQCACDVSLILFPTPMAEATELYITIGCIAWQGRSLSSSNCA